MNWYEILEIFIDKICEREILMNQKSYFNKYSQYKNNSLRI